MTRRPDFLVMGVPKAGTTSFHHYLRHHPQVFLPEHKEVHYFTRAALQRCVAGPGDGRNVNGVCDSLESYLQLFRTAPADQVVGEVSPSYFYFTECYELIRAALGDGVKLVVLFRNPIDRAFSNYLHLRRSGRESLSLLAALEREEERIQQGYGDFWRYKDHSRYTARLSELLSVFPREQVLPLSFHDLVDDPAALLGQVSRFLDIDDTFVPPNVQRVFNSSGGRSRSGRLGTWLGSPSSLRTRAKRVFPESMAERYRTVRDATLARGGAPLPSLDQASYRHLVAAVGGEVRTMGERYRIDLSRSTYRPEPTDPVGHESAVRPTPT